MVVFVNVNKVIQKTINNNVKNATLNVYNVPQNPANVCPVIKTNIEHLTQLHKIVNVKADFKKMKMRNVLVMKLVKNVMSY